MIDQSVPSQQTAQVKSVKVPNMIPDDLSLLESERAKYMKAPFHGSLKCHFTFSTFVIFCCDSCFLALNPPRGDSGVSERVASDLSQFAVQARALSVHPQASQ